MLALPVANLMHHKLRSFLTLLGVMAGVSTVIMMVSFVVGFNAAVRAGFTTFYDEKAAIGRRYRRQDEIGTPYCVTIDGDTLAEDVVTVRERDSMEQARVAVPEVRSFLEEAIRGWSR